MVWLSPHLSNFGMAVAGRTSHTISAANAWYHFDLSGDHSKTVVEVFPRVAHCQYHLLEPSVTVWDLLKLYYQGVVTTMCPICFHLRWQSRNSIVKMRLDCLIHPLKLAWLLDLSLATSVLIAWFLVVNGYVYKHIWSVTPIYHSRIVYGIKMSIKLLSQMELQAYIAVTTPWLFSS